MTISKGRSVGISYGGTGSLIAEVINIGGNLTINIDNPTPEVIAELRKIQHVEIKASDTTEKVKEARQSIDWVMDLVSKVDNKVGAPIQAIRAGNMEISRNELLSKDAEAKAYEHWSKGDYQSRLRVV